MAVTVIKAGKVVRAALGLLEREIVLPQLVWRDAGGDFRGTKDDTITLTIPAFTNSRRRTLRGGRPITVDGLGETKVDVKLTDDIYKAVGIDDEELTLDIADFGAQVLNPVVGSVARGVEDLVAETVDDAVFAVSIDLDEDDPWLGIVDARTALGKHRVPASQRFLFCGANVEAAILKSDRLSKVDSAGSDSALREAIIGRIAGFTAVPVPGMDPDKAVAGHKTAIALGMQAPVVPDGVSWGETATHAGLAMRVIKDYDFVNVKDRLLADVFAGCSITKDHGSVDEDTGIFTPTADPDPDDDEDLIVVRAVELLLPTGS